MRLGPLLLGLTAFTSAMQIPQLQPFLSALPPALLEYLPLSISNNTAHDLLKRQDSNTCPQNFNSCANLGAVGLCCSPSAVCSADYAGHVACCPSGAACTGTINGIITAGTVDSNGAIVGAGGAGSATMSGGSLIGASQATTTAGFQDASSTTGNGLVLASTTSGTTGLTSTGAATTGNGGFIIDGSSTVATPGAAVRGAQIPLVARAILRAIEYLPM